jgi:hypothetical protein
MWLGPSAGLVVIVPASHAGRSGPIVPQPAPTYAKIGLFSLVLCRLHPHEARFTTRSLSCTSSNVADIQSIAMKSGLFPAGEGEPGTAVSCPVEESIEYAEILAAPPLHT